MNLFTKARLFRQVVAVIAICLPAFVYAQSSVMQNYKFSYSILEAQSNNVDLLALVRSEILSDVMSNGGVVYALWSPAEMPEDAPFAGLTDNQLGLMLAWPDSALAHVDALDDALQALESVAVISSRLFEALYLPAGLNVPSAEGFYVHREEKYALDNVNDAIRLSKEAWVTWEPHWGVTVIGLFREIGSAAGLDNLNRIVWYPSHEGWLETRNFTEDMESANRFRERRSMLIPGSGIAIATDRAIN